MRVGSLEKKILLTLLKKGANTVRELAYDIEGINDVSGVRGSSFYRSVRSLEVKGFIKTKIIFTCELEGMRAFNFWKRHYSDSQFFTTKTKLHDDGGYFHLYGLTVEGRNKAIEIKKKLIDFKNEWDKFL